MEEKRPPGIFDPIISRHVETGLAGVVAMIIGCLCIFGYGQYLIGTLSLLIGVGIIVVLLAVEMRQRRKP